MKDHHPSRTIDRAGGAPAGDRDPETTPDDVADQLAGRATGLPEALIDLEPDGWSRRVLVLLERFGVLPVAAGAVLVIAVGAVALRVFAPTPAAVDDQIPLAPAHGTPPATQSAGSAPATADILVHAAGEISTPGVYELPSGSRIIDLVEAAGGVTEAADLDRVNLAAGLPDGGRVYIPAVGEQAPPATVAGGAFDAEPGSAVGAGGQVDVNTADMAALETLPGVGPATAQAIIDHREEYGPFEIVDDLITVPGIGEAKLAGLRDLAVAG